MGHHAAFVQKDPSGCNRPSHDGQFVFLRGRLNLESPISPQMLTAHAHPSGGVHFTPDGKTVACPIRENGVDNIWVQPLDGSGGGQISQFNSDQIDAFHWSPDGKNLALLRSHSESDGPAAGIEALNPRFLFVRGSVSCANEWTAGR